MLTIQNRESSKDRTVSEMNQCRDEAMRFANVGIYRYKMNGEVVSIDEATLERIARNTRGRFWHATDTDSLREIYAEIDRLEKTKTEEKRYFQFTEMATDTVQLGGITVPPVLTIVAALLALEIVLINTRFRKVP